MIEFLKTSTDPQISKGVDALKQLSVSEEKKEKMSAPPETVQFYK